MHRAIVAFMCLIGSAALLVSCTTMKKTAPQQPTAPQQKKGTVVILDTTMGKIVLKLFPDKAPKACENFTGLANKGYYDGLIFHRVINNFMIQGGDPTGTGRGGQSVWGAPFEDEFSLDLRLDRPGILAMANAGPKTNGSQFFITLAPTPWLNDKHTVFGEVIEGMDVVKKIGEVPVGPGDKPLTDVVIKKAAVGRQ
ncbi:MAG: peptidylprolyl isomerase [Candidatus Aureabacteria bacterium]|nr:peptidylprolyl isomerase [Candidatus Auribacterota bacterium]